MQLNSILAATCLLGAVSLVNADADADPDFVVVTSSIEFPLTEFPLTFSEAYQASSWANEKVSKINSAISTYAAAVTADPAYASYTSAVAEFFATRTDVDPAATDVGTTITYTTEPPWFTALPSDIRSFYSSLEAAQISIFQEVVAEDSPSSGAGVRYKGQGWAGFAAVGALVAGVLLL